MDSLEPLPLDELTAEALEPHVGAVFATHTDGGEVALRLTGVRRLAGTSTTGARGQAFALDFVGPAEPLLPQAIWSLAAPAVGRLDIFIVPIGRDRDGRVSYEAIFN